MLRPRRVLIVKGPTKRVLQLDGGITGSACQCLIQKTSLLAADKVNQ